MIRSKAGPEGGAERGSILLPVMVVLLLIASAATAMTLQAKASLRGAATHRDRLALGYTADGLVRAAAVALAQATANKAAPPFALDGTPQSCRLDARRLAVLTVQDQGGLVDLNKAPADLLMRIFAKAGVGGTEANTLSRAILAVREPGTAPQAKGGLTQRPAPQPVTLASGFASADQLDGLPGMTRTLYDTLRPLLTTGNGAAGIDPVVAGPALRRLISRRDMAAADFQTFAIPSFHTGFDITAAISLPSGMRFTRHAAFRLDPSAGPAGRFLEWDAPADTAPLQTGGQGAFCAAFAKAVSAS